MHNTSNYEFWIANLSQFQSRLTIECLIIQEHLGCVGCVRDNSWKMSCIKAQHICFVILAQPIDCLMNMFIIQKQKVWIRSKDWKSWWSLKTVQMIDFKRRSHLFSFYKMFQIAQYFQKKNYPVENSLAYKTSTCKFDTLIEQSKFQLAQRKPYFFRKLNSTKNREKPNYRVVVD